MRVPPAPVEGQAAQDRTLDVEVVDETASTSSANPASLQVPFLRRALAAAILRGDNSAAGRLRRALNIALNGPTGMTGPWIELIEKAPAPERGVNGRIWLIKPGSITAISSDLQGGDVSVYVRGVRQPIQTYEDLSAIAAEVGVSPRARCCLCRRALDPDEGETGNVCSTCGGHIADCEDDA